MVTKFKIVFAVLAGFFISSGFFSRDEPTITEIKHTISIKHPGEAYAIETTLTEIRNLDGMPVSYFMDVESVICLAKVCKVIPVRLYWNPIGEYQKYTLKEGATLEKYEADSFEPEDYTKIHSIMANINSPFKEVYLEDIWTVPTTLSEDIDALSSETILELNDEDTVPGAALTCYTLWHWANGEVCAIIKQKTGKAVSKKQLKRFITEGEEGYFNIALNELAERKLFHENFINAIIERAVSERKYNKRALLFLEKSPSETFLSALDKLFFKGKKELKLMVIQTLKKRAVEIPKNYLDKFSSSFTTLESYQEISALMELMHQKNVNSEIVISNIVSLLDSEFLVARQAYWFLSKREVSSQIKEKLENFHVKHHQRL